MFVSDFPVHICFVFTGLEPDMGTFILIPEYSRTVLVVLVEIGTLVSYLSKFSKVLMESADSREGRGLIFCGLLANSWQNFSSSIKIVLMKKA